MRANELYAHLERDFHLAECEDDWSMMQDSPYVSENFKRRHMGLLADNTDEITRVFTAVFPSKKVIADIKASSATHALLFTHHPMNCDLARVPIFYEMDDEEYKTLKDRQISIYTLHTPLDNNGPYSTSINLGKALNMDHLYDLYPYNNHFVGFIGKTQCRTIQELQSKLEAAIGHRAALYQYGTDEIRDGMVGMVAGGGNAEGVYEDLHRMGVNAYITGIANMRTGYPPAVKAHERAKDRHISILAGTHYSTEKFACMKMTEYFENLGLETEFLADTPDFNDL